MQTAPPMRTGTGCAGIRLSSGYARDGCPPEASNHGASRSPTGGFDAVRRRRRSVSLRGRCRRGIGNVSRPSLSVAVCVGRVRGSKRLSIPLVVHAVAVAVGEVEARPVHPLPLASVACRRRCRRRREAEEAGVRQPDGVGADELVCVTPGA